MITAWLLSFYIDCGFFCYNRRENIEYSSKEDCIEQMKMIEERVIKQGYNVKVLYCKPKIEGVDG